MMTTLLEDAKWYAKESKRCGEDAKWYADKSKQYEHLYNYLNDAKEED